MREVGGAKKLMAMMLCGLLMWTACSSAWINEAEQIVAALIPAMANLVALVAALQGQTVSAADLETIQNAGAQIESDLQLMQSLIGQYERAEASVKPGLLNQIQQAMRAAQATLSGILPALHIKDTATQAKVAAVIGILLAEVQSLAEIVPLVNSGAASGAMAMAARRAPSRAREFTDSYNAAMTARTGNTFVDHAAGGLRIHWHGKFARWASVGILK